jgi:beta-xylosidase
MRGEIEHPERAQQINEFKELRYGSITPTDIDGLIEYKDSAYVFIEVKYNGKELPFGQRLAITRLVNDTSCAGKESIALIVNHTVGDASQRVQVADCEVRELYYSAEKQWRKPIKKMTAGAVITKFLERIK